MSRPVNDNVIPVDFARTNASISITMDRQGKVNMKLDGNIWSISEAVIKATAMVQDYIKERMSDGKKT